MKGKLNHPKDWGKEEIEQEECISWCQHTPNGDLSLKFANCVISHESWNLSTPHFLICKMELIVMLTSWVVVMSKN